MKESDVMQVLKELGYESDSSGTWWADEHDKKSSSECDDTKIDIVLPAPSDEKKLPVM
jgi:hypothetical protein